MEFVKDDNGVKVGNKRGFWVINPIEYKNGKPEKSDSDACQLCAVAMCLEEMFNVVIESGDIFYGQLKRRTKIEFTKELREKVKNVILSMSAILTSNEIPSKTIAQNCSLCSLANICLPTIFENFVPTKNKLLK